MVVGATGEVTFVSPEFHNVKTILELTKKMAGRYPSSHFSLYVSFDLQVLFTFQIIRNLFEEKASQRSVYHPVVIGM